MITDWQQKTVYEIGRTSNHIYLCPHWLLRPYIAHYTIWTASTTKQPSVELLTLVPDASGCAVLHLDDTNVSGSLWGATTHAVTVNGGADVYPVLVFIEFLPGGLFQFTGMSQSALTDGIFSLNDVVPLVFSALCRLLVTARCVENLVNGLDTILLPILLAREAPAAVRLLNSDRPLTYLAQESGFYDQAHFIRDFKEVCGITPGGYRNKMSDFYNEPLKF